MIFTADMVAGSLSKTDGLLEYILLSTYLSLALAALWVCLLLLLFSPQRSAVTGGPKQSVFLLGLVLAIYDFIKDCIKKAIGRQNRSHNLA